MTKIITLGLIAASLLVASVPAQAGYRCYWLSNTMYCN